MIKKGRLNFRRPLIHHPYIIGNSLPFSALAALAMFTCLVSGPFLDFRASPYFLANSLLALVTLDSVESNMKPSLLICLAQ